MHADFVLASQANARPVSQEAPKGAKAAAAKAQAAAPPPPLPVFILEPKVGIVTVLKGTSDVQLSQVMLCSNWLDSDTWEADMIALELAPSMYPYKCRYW